MPGFIKTYRNEPFLITGTSRYGTRILITHPEEWKH